MTRRDQREPSPGEQRYLRELSESHVLEVGSGGPPRPRKAKLYIAHAVGAETIISGNSHLGLGGGGRKGFRGNFWKIKR